MSEVYCTMQGSRTLFDRFVYEEPENKAPARKGRSADLLHQRNIFMCHLYYTKILLERKSYQDSIAEMSSQMYLSEKTVIDILSKDKYREMIAELKDKEIDRKDLFLKYPHWKW